MTGLWWSLGLCGFVFAAIGLAFLAVRVEERQVLRSRTPGGSIQTPDSVEPQPSLSGRAGVEDAPPAHPSSEPSSSVRRTPGCSVAALRGPVAEPAGIEDADYADATLPAASVGACHGSASAPRAPHPRAGAAIPCPAPRQAY